ncbi:MAG: hypothetical protein IKE56_05235 [Lachnospiraceae bacterium]|jgi:hypothetical protein|nr:hypothetical protein [Lachnospiraceae bacterium]
MGKKKKAAFAGGAVVLAAALLSRLPQLPGFGGGNGFGIFGGTGSGVRQEAAAEQTGAIEETDSTADMIEETESAAVMIEETVTVEGTESKIDMTEEEGADASAEETEEPAIEYVIEIRDDEYFLEGTKVSEERVEALLREGGAVFRIDNNYGSRKAVSRLKELFLAYDVPFVE